MNNGIRKFFDQMMNQNLDIDKVLDIMDYMEEGDRSYKKEFICSLQKVHEKYLFRKP